MIDLKKIGKQTKIVAAIALAVVVGSVATLGVQAAIPDTDGKIYACYLNTGTFFNAKGTIQVIDKATTSCPSGTTAISWDQVSSGDELTPINVGDNLTDGQMMYRDLTGVNLTNTDLTNVKFTGSNLTNVNLTGARVVSVNGDRVKFNNVDFRPVTQLFQPNFTNSEFKNTNFSGMNIGLITGESAVFINTDFSGADFTNAVFATSNLTGSIFTGATMTGATWDTVICPDGTNSNDNGNTCIGHL